MSEFPCTQCGLCCRLIGAILKSQDALANDTVRAVIDEFPYNIDKNGVCEKLVDNKCTVYNTRPLLCDVTRMAQTLGLPLEDWYRSNAEVCNTLIKEAGLDDSYLITAYDQ